MTIGDDNLKENTTYAAHALIVLVLVTLGILVTIPVVSGELLLTDQGEDSFYTEDAEHYSGTLYGGANVTVNSPANICGHYGMQPHSNTNSFKYFNGNTSADGLNTGNNNPVYTAILDGTQTYYEHVAEAADCNGYWKPYRYWDNGNYTPRAASS
jgi:hypothetical protein